MLRELERRIEEGGRLSADEALFLYREAPTHWLGRAADLVRTRRHPDGVVTYIIDRNVNYTNVCVARCNFCAFYRQVGASDGYVLGFEEIAKPDSLAGRGGFWLELGDLQIHFGAEDGVDRSKSKAHVAYLVDDLEGWRNILSRNGYELIDGIPIPGYDRFEFRDPFANRVEFLQKR